jgi:pimeloyl-ACP methyl ester carboxylesterase
MPFILSHRILAEPGASKTAFVLHGILGSGQNFMGFAQKLWRRCPEYRYVLIDLRNHGASVGAPPPHTVAACAGDLAELAGQVGAPELIVGHSFGGKVALEYTRQHGALLRQVWALDSNPGAATESAHREVDSVIRTTRAVPMPQASRAAVVQHLTASGGMSKPMAEWIATSLKRSDAGYVWGFDLDGIQALIEDYYTRDLWGFLAEQRSAPDIHLVIAEKSDRWDPEMRRRAQALAENTRVMTHLLPNSGHWVHVDNPQALLELMASKLGC